MDRLSREIVTCWYLQSKFEEGLFLGKNLTFTATIHEALPFTEKPTCPVGVPIVGFLYKD